MNRIKGIAFGFIPVWVEDDTIEGRWFWCDWLFSFVEPLWALCCFLSGVEPEGYPVMVKEDQDED